MTDDDRIELLAALVQRKWRALRSAQALAEPDSLCATIREEWAAASLLLELAQDAAIRKGEAYFAATRAANELYQFVLGGGDINRVRDELIEVVLPTSKN